jgi:hypothetical protein
MHGLLKASLLLAPALATAFVAPGVGDEDIEVDRIIAGNYVPSTRGTAKLIMPAARPLSRSYRCRNPIPVT